MGRKRDQQIRLGLAVRRRGTRGNQSFMQGAVGFTHESEERCVDAQQAFALVQVAETNVETELHAVRIISEKSLAEPRCKSEIAYSSSPAARPASARRARAWQPRMAPRW